MRFLSAYRGKYKRMSEVVLPEFGATAAGTLLAGRSLCITQEDTGNWRVFGE